MAGNVSFLLTDRQIRGGAREEILMFKRIVVGVANSPTAVEAARRAQELAQLCGARLELVTAYSGSDAFDSAERKHAEALVERFAGQYPGDAASHALRGHPAEVLLQVADEVGADLIVVGNLGMKGVHRVLGSVPNSVAHKASCAVLIVNTV